LKEEVFWRLRVGVGGSLKFSGIAEVGDSDPLSLSGTSLRSV
jgi:hypothetical protein